MSSYTLQFQTVKNKFSLTEGAIVKGKEIVEIVFKNNNKWQINLFEFIFRAIGNKVVSEKGLYKDLKIHENYRAIVGRNENLSSGENDFCDKLDAYLSQSKDRDEFKKRIGTLYELYICKQKIITHNHAIVYRESKAKLNGANITGSDSSSTCLDVVVDERKKELKITLIECTLSSKTFIKNRKDDELKLYRNVCKEIRNVDKDIILIIELASACNDKYSISEYGSYLLNEFNELNVLVYGIESNINTQTLLKNTPTN